MWAAIRIPRSVVFAMACIPSLIQLHWPHGTHYFGRALFDNFFFRFQSFSSKTKLTHQHLFAVCRFCALHTVFSQPFKWMTKDQFNVIFLSIFLVTNETMNKIEERKWKAKVPAVTIDLDFRLKIAGHFSVVPFDFFFYCASIYVCVILSLSSLINRKLHSFLFIFFAAFWETIEVMVFARATRWRRCRQKLMCSLFGLRQSSRRRFGRWLDHGETCDHKPLEQLLQLIEKSDCDYCVYSCVANDHSKDCDYFSFQNSIPHFLWCKLCKKRK